MTTETQLRPTGAGTDDLGYTITMTCGCRVVSGQVPLRDISTLCHGFSKKALMAIDLAALMGVAFVIGEPKDIERMRANRASLPISESRQHDAEVAKVCGLPQGLANWLRVGERGASSEALCQSIFGVPGGARRTDHPHDPDDLRRCIAFLKATDIVGADAFCGKVAALSEQWAALMSRWEELLDCYAGELQTPVPSNQHRMMPKTYALMQEIIGGAHGDPAATLFSRVVQPHQEPVPSASQKP